MELGYIPLDPQSEENTKKTQYVLTSKRNRAKAAMT